jgi:hypothetical protein
MYSFDLRPLIWFGALLILLIWGAWELIDWLWIEETIESSTLIIPEIKLVVNNNIVDTIYVYKIPANE